MLDDFKLVAMTKWTAGKKPVDGSLQHGSNQATDRLVYQGVVAVQGNGCLVHRGFQSLLDGVHRIVRILSLAKMSH